MSHISRAVPTYGFLRLAALTLAAIVMSSCGGNVTLAPQPNNAALQAALQSDVDDYLRSRSAIEHISTVSLDVSLRGQPTNIDVSAGTTTYGGTTPVTSASLFEIGSNTKAFTAATLLQLEAEGKLSIHDTVGKWLPQYPEWANVTLESLLNMTSGIPGYDNLPAFGTAFGQDPNRSWTISQLVAFSQGMPLQSGWLYSNTNYLLAEMIVEKASNDTYAHQLASRFFGPLGLTQTYYDANAYPPSITNRMVSGYFYNAAITSLAALLGQDIKTYNVSWTQGAGGIVASLPDVTKWVRALYEGSMLATAQRQELLSIVSDNTGRPIATTTLADPTGFGLGVGQLTNSKTGLLWYYQGETLGYRVVYIYLPQSRTICTIGVNSQPYGGPDRNEDKLLLLIQAIYASLKSAGDA